MSVPKEHLVQDEGMSEPTAHAHASFWNEVKAATGDNTLGVIRMGGLLDAQRSQANPPGPLAISATAVQGGYDLTESGAQQNGDVQQVYWLPWKNQSCEYVPMTTLNQSGCRYFLTSMLTGCRFVVTETYVAHISNEQLSPSREIDTSQRGRDLAEIMMYSAKANLQPTVSRRRLSISQHAGEAIADADTHQSYLRSGTRGSGSAFVIGYLENDIWVFKWLKHELSQQFAKGSWSILQ